MTVGFVEALKNGVDVIGAIASVMVRMGEELSGQARGMNFSLSLLHPKIVFRLVQAWIRSKREHSDNCDRVYYILALLPLYSHLYQQQGAKKYSYLCLYSFCGDHRSFPDRPADQKYVSV